MTKVYKRHCKSAAFAVLMFGLLFISGSYALATSVDRMSLTNLEGYPGKTVEQNITLEGTDTGERSGFWYTNYRKIEGDNKRMDITSWITIEPKEFTIRQGEIKTFAVKLNIPKNAEAGLWGAASPDAGKEGHSGERRTYIVFKDALGGGNVYSGLLIPISVKVLPNPNPLAGVINFVRQNTTTVALSIVIVILMAMLLRKKRKMV